MTTNAQETAYDIALAAAPIVGAVVGWKKAALLGALVGGGAGLALSLVALVSILIGALAAYLLCGRSKHPLTAVAPRELGRGSEYVAYLSPPRTTDSLNPMARGGPAAATANPELACFPPTTTLAEALHPPERSEVGPHLRRVA